MKNGCRSAFAIALAAPLLAAPAAGEIYRWRDASGREHFATDIHQVPPEHRPAAAEWTRERAEGNVTFHPSPAPASAAAPAPAAPAATAPGPSAVADCERVRKRALKLQARVEKKERVVERYDDYAGDIGRSAYSRRKWEIRRDAAQAELDQAQREYDRFWDRKRRQGIEPGCLR